MNELRYDRLYRTPSSEAYLLSRGEQPIARLELHFAQTAVYGLLLFEHAPPSSEVSALIAQVDDDLVWTAGVPRRDLVISVYSGRELGVFDDTRRREQAGDAGASER